MHKQLSKIEQFNQVCAELVRHETDLLWCIDRTKMARNHRDEPVKAARQLQGKILRCPKIEAKPLWHKSCIELVLYLF